APGAAAGAGTGAPGGAGAGTGTRAPGGAAAPAGAGTAAAAPAGPPDSAAGGVRLIPEHLERYRGTKGWESVSIEAYWYEEGNPYAAPRGGGPALGGHP